MDASSSISEPLSFSSEFSLLSHTRLFLSSSSPLAASSLSWSSSNLSALKSSPSVTSLLSNSMLSHLLTLLTSSPPLSLLQQHVKSEQRNAFVDNHVGLEKILGFRAFQKKLPASNNNHFLRNIVSMSSCKESSVHKYKNTNFRTNRIFSLGNFKKADNNITKLFASKEIFMPALSSTMKEGKIVKWNKNVGEMITTGEVVMVVESDKADMDVESFETGYIAKILVPEGEIAPVGSTVALLSETLEEIPLSSASSSPSPLPTLSTSTENTIIDITLPALSASMKKGYISKWKKKKNDFFKKGETIFVVESDKADMDVDAPYDGILQEIYLKEGVIANVGDITCRIMVHGSPEDILDYSSNSAVSPLPISRFPENTKEIFMPALSLSMTKPKILKMNKHVGDFVKKGDIFMLIESENDPFEIKAYDQGYLAATRYGEGDAVGIGEVIAYVVQSIDDIPHVQSIMPSSPDITKRRTRFDTEDKSWTLPAVDQDVKSLTPPLISSSELSQVYENRIAQNLPDAHQFLQKNPKILISLKERLTLRPPPPHTLFPRDQNASSSRICDQNATQNQCSENYNPSEAQIYASPNAIEFAKNKNMDLASIKGTGPNSRIMGVDVRKHLQITSEEDHVYSKKLPSLSSSSLSVNPMRNPLHKGTSPLTSIQKAIWKNMEATLNIPVFRVSRTIKMNEMERLLNQLRHIQTMHDDFDKSKKQNNPKTSMTILLVKAVALALARNSIINSSFDETNGGQIKNSGEINIAIAVSTAKELYTPVLKNADEKSLTDLSLEFTSLVNKARKNELRPSDLSGATFYISNLGMYGVSQFDAILPKGVGSILAVSSSSSAFSPQMLSNFPTSLEHETPKQMTVTITCDHRHIYGAHAAQFLKDLAEIIEITPAAILL